MSGYDGSVINTTWRDRNVEVLRNPQKGCIAVGVCTDSGTYYEAGRGLFLPSFLFDYRNRTIMLLVDLDDRIVYAGMGSSDDTCVGYPNHSVLADEIGIPVGAEFDRLARPVYRDGVLSFNRVQVGVPVNLGLVDWDNEDFRYAASKNILRASRILVHVGMAKNTRTECQWLVLPLGVFVK